MASDPKTIKELVDAIIADGKITKDEQRRLNDFLMADGKVDAEENAQIKRIMDLMNEGVIKLVD